MKPFLLLLVFSPLAVQANIVLSVGDGDTITVLEGGTKTKVRLACIDAPETAQRPFGQQSRKKLKAAFMSSSRHLYWSMSRRQKCLVGYMQSLDLQALAKQQ